MVCTSLGSLLRPLFYFLCYIHFSLSVQGYSSGHGKGFVKCFLRVPQAVGLYCSRHAAQASKGNFQKTFNKTFPMT